MVTVDPKMRESIDSIKAELGQRRLVTRPRQTGKTTALFEFIHEYCAGFCYLVTISENYADQLKRQYRRMYPEDEQPILVSYRLLSHRGIGLHLVTAPRVWLSDEVWPSMVEEKEDEFTQLTFLGGVGTPMCMDQHSHY